jgi:hypothetical protein
METPKLGVSTICVNPYNQRYLRAFVAASVLKNVVNPMFVTICREELKQESDGSFSYRRKKS